MAMCGEIEIKDRPPLTTLQSQWKAMLQDMENDSEADRETDNKPDKADP